MDCGRWTGLSQKEIEEKYPKSFKIWKERKHNFVCDGGESFDECKERISKEIIRICKKHDNEQIAVFTHGGCVRAFEIFAKNIPYGQIDKVEWIPNASSTFYEYENGVFRLKNRCEDFYLKKIKTRTEIIL